MRPFLFCTVDKTNVLNNSLMEMAGGPVPPKTNLRMKFLV